MIPGLVLLILLVGMLFSLFRALGMMLNPPKDQGAMVKALSWRIGFSLVVFVILIGGWYFGFWMPHALGRA